VSRYSNSKMQLKIGLSIIHLCVVLYFTDGYFVWQQKEQKRNIIHFVKCDNYMIIGSEATGKISSKIAKNGVA